MTNGIISKFLPRTEFSSYEDFVSNFKLNIPENFNFGFDIVDYFAETDPDKIALVWCNDFNEEKIITFGELKSLSNKTANALKALGIKKGDKVLMIMGRRYEYWITAVALHKMGTIAIPASHLLTARDLSYRNNSAKIKAIIACDEPQVLDAVDESMQSCPTVEHKILINNPREGWISLKEISEKASDVFPRPTGDEATKNEDILIMYFTSGTTGLPKILAHDQTYPLGHIITAKYWQNVEENGLHLTVADTGWAKASWGKMYGQWICGSAVFVYDYDKKFDAKNMLKILEKYRITTFCAPTTVFRLIGKEDCTKYDLSSLSYCVVAGEPLSPAVFKSIKDAFGIELYEGFGQSETVVAVANFPWMKVKPGSMGKPSPSYEIDLVDSEGNSVPCGVEGEIVFKIDKQWPYGLFRCYYCSEELTAKAFCDGVYHTGDIAIRDEDGYLLYVGRCDDTIKTSGYKVGPYEVESVLLEHPAVLESVVTGVPDPIRGKIIKASIILNEGYTPSDELIKDIQNFVKHATAPYKYPRIVEFVTEIAKTTSGKIKRYEGAHCK